ncbi:helix-turn-helix domain-containing protein [Streptomyces sp. NPDC050560]|uniref:helix-turn-helix domain-containing protein n=1 Tax=Streptomyces sp. NPDC050560 TaxID=3365630 RepID=UPI0037AD8B83
MPHRDHPTARQARLGAELRKMRESAGLAAREAAGLLSVDQARISHIEAGRVGVSETRLRRLAHFYGCPDEELISALCDITREHRGQFWFDEYRGILAPVFLDVAEMEHHAVAMCALQNVTLPGILQTKDYARTLFSGVLPRLSDDEIDARVEHRMRRFHVLERPEPPVYEAIVHEAAVRMRFGGRKVAREQLNHLMDAAGLPTVTLRIVPFTSEDFVEATQSVVYAHAVVPQLDVVQIDAVSGGSFLDAEADLRTYRTLLDSARKATLSPDESRTLIHHIAREL